MYILSRLAPELCYKLNLKKLTSPGDLYLEGLDESPFERNISMIPYDN